MKKHRVVAALAALGILFFNGCGSNSKPDGSTLANIKQAGMSIEYISSNYVENKGIVSLYRVHIADQNGKPINANVKMSVINGVKKMSVNGVIHNTQPITFDDPSISFNGVVPGDKLIVLPGGNNLDPVSYGDWTITGIQNGMTLQLKEGAYHLNDGSGLYYLIGNEKRTLGTRVGVVHIENAEQNATEDGYVYFNVVADAILAGHTITLGAHTEGNRLGASLVAAVRGASFTATPVTVPVDGTVHYVSMTLWIDPTGNGGEIEYLIDMEVNPGSFSAEGNCRILYNESNFHTNEGGQVLLAVSTGTATGTSTCTGGTSCSASTNTTEANDTNATECTISWAGGIGSLFMEY